MKRLLLACVVLACLPATAAAQDTTAPHTTLTVPAPRITFVYQPFSVEFEADEPATFECRTFNGPWTPCSSPRYYANETYPGEHLYVRATDLAGNVEATPAHTFWTANQLVADVQPMIRGALEPGRPLSCSDAQWPSPVASAPKEWHRSGTGELLGTGDTYTVTTADLDLQLYCSVAAVKDGYTITTAYSTRFPEVLYKALPPSTPCVSSTADGGKFDDPIEPGLSPDLFSASADTDDRCGLEVATTVDHMWSTDKLYSYVDSDGNPATGDTDHDGAERLVTVTGDANAPRAELFWWNPAKRAYAQAKGVPVQWNALHSTLTWRAAISDLGFTPNVVAHLRTWTSDGVGWGYDVAPDIAKPAFAFPVRFWDGTGFTTTTAPPADIPAAPKAIKAPRLTGTARVGKRLTCSAGTWTGTPQLTYAWKRNGKAIKGAKKKTYTVRATDRRKKLSCSVTAKNAGGTKTVTARSVRIK